MITYAIGDAKYERSSFSAIARTLRIGHLSWGWCCALGWGGRLSRGRSVFGGHLQEDFLQAHPHRPQLQQPPPTRDDLAGEIATDVVAALAFHFEGTGVGALIRRRDAIHPGHLLQAGDDV